MLKSGRAYWKGVGLSVLGLLLAAFALPYIPPGPPVQRFMSWPDYSEQRERLVADYGFDRSLPVQFLVWLQRMGTGNWGQSRHYSHPVFQDMLQAAGTTLMLLLWIILLGGCCIVVLHLARCCIPHAGPTAPQRMSPSRMEIVPGFLLAIALHEVALWQLGWIHVVNVSLSHSYYLFNPSVMLFPTLSLALLPIILWCRNWPAPSDTGRRGWHQARRRWQSFRHAFHPLLGYFLLDLMLTEYIFSIPGLGRFGIEALRRRDFPSLQGFIIGLGCIYLVLYVLIAPRRRASRHTEAASAPPVVTDTPSVLQAHTAIQRGTIGLVALLALAVWAPQLSPYRPMEIHTQDQLLGPSRRYILGTDFLGRDILSRTLEGFHNAIPRMLIIMLVTVGVSVLVHAGTRFFPRPCRVLGRWLAMLLAPFPPFVLACMAFLMFEHRPWGIEMALIVASIPLAYRGIAADSSLPSRIAVGASLCDVVLLLQVIFFYLNLSPDPLAPTWGSDLRIGRHYSNMNIWLFLAPGLALILSRSILFQFKIYGWLAPATSRLFVLRRRHSSHTPTATMARLTTWGIRNGPR